MSKHSKYRMRRFVGAVVCVLALGVTSSARANVYRVGGDPACTHQSLQAAINDAEQNPGEDVVRVAATQTYQQLALTIGSQDLSLLGGYAHCGEETPTANPTLLDGAQGLRASVILVTGDGLRRFERLTIVGGDNESGYGGGISYDGVGELVLRDVTVRNNRAKNGGGIAVHGDNGFAKLTVQANVTLAENFATEDGGGLHARDGAKVAVDGFEVRIVRNQAPGTNPSRGYGGGIYITDDAQVDLGTGGTFAGVLDNAARHGGGIAVHEPTQHYALHLRVSLKHPGYPVRIAGNRASERGGGVFAESVGGQFPKYANLYFGASVIEANRAPDGAALYFDEDDGRLGLGEKIGPSVTFNDVEGGVGAPRHRIWRNVATAGAVIVQRDGNNSMRRVEMFDNEGASLIRVFDGELGLANVAAFHNRVTERLVELRDRASLRATLVTLAQNAVGGNAVIMADVLDSRVSLGASIVWQPDRLVFANSYGAANTNVSSKYGMLSDASGIGPDDVGSVVSDPRFMDAENGDLRLRGGSPAVDFAPLDDLRTWDLEGRARPVDLVAHVDAAGPADAGAYERPSLGNLVVHGDFDSGLHAWRTVPGNAAVAPYLRHSTNDSGSDPASGSFEVDIPGTSELMPPWYMVVGRRQCVPLPGPGRYRLTARGYASGNRFSRDSPLVSWEYRAASSVPCDGAPPLQSGLVSFQFAAFGGWGEPFGGPATIDIPDGLWQPGASIELGLRGDRSPNDGPFDDLEVAFDAVSLEHENDDVNTGPVAGDDTLLVTARGGTATRLDDGQFSLMRNDVDADADPLAVRIHPILNPSHGFISLQPDGRFTYIHNGTETDEDTFVYRVCDPSALCDDAIVTVRIGDTLFANGFE